ncbi:hypothetical protein, partial [Pseudomonas khavaziana]|uniref:hypothetical protein n=1 Tax=Pseudomonas khavaziana TaxID=2842351 RepID=UPI001C3D906F
QTGEKAKVYDTLDHKLADKDGKVLANNTKLIVTGHKLGTTQVVSGDATIKDGQLVLSDDLKHKMAGYDQAPDLKTTDSKPVYRDPLTGKLVKDDKGTALDANAKVVITGDSAVKGVIVDGSGDAKREAGLKNPTPVGTDDGIYRKHDAVTHSETLVDANGKLVTQVKTP